MNAIVLRATPGGEIFHRWFVQYNPFYFGSALLVLGGAFLLTRNPGDWVEGELALAGVIQLYELALILGAGLLFDRPGQRRPAVILGIVAVVFLFDVTFRTEGMASVGLRMLPASLAWGLLLGLKLALLARALRVRVPAAMLVLWTVAALMLAVAPHLIGAGIAPRTVLAAACWLGIALVMQSLWQPSRVRSEVPLDDWGHVVLARVATLSPAFWSVLYWAHVLAWSGIYDLELTPACFTPVPVLLLVALPREKLVWIAAAGVLAAAVVSQNTFPAVAALVLLGLVIKAYRAGWPRLYVGAVLAAHLALWSLFGGALGLVPPVWLTLASAVLLVLIAWRWRLPSAWLCSALCASPALVPLLPATRAHWGVALLASGFLALGSGLALNWWSSRFAPSRAP